MRSDTLERSITSRQLVSFLAQFLPPLFFSLSLSLLNFFFFSSCVLYLVLRYFFILFSLVVGGEQQTWRGYKPEWYRGTGKLMSFYWEPDHSSSCTVLWMQIGCNFIKGTLLRITYDRASIALSLLPSLHPTPFLLCPPRHCTARNTVICDFSGHHDENYNVPERLIRSTPGFWLCW